MKTQKLYMEAYGFKGIYNDRTYSLNGILWLPDDGIEVKSVIQIIHGMTEHMGRYEKFAERMTEVGIAVAGYDLRGHGMNVGDDNVASFISGKSSVIGDYGWSYSVFDVENIFMELKRMFPNARHFMMGFSLGSFLLRDFIREIGNLGADGFIFVGTGYQPKFVTDLMKKLVAKEIQKAGEGCTTDKVRSMTFGSYNKKFTPNCTEYDWLCSDAKELEAYINDPLVRKDISADLFYDMIDAIGRTCCKSACSSPYIKDTPVLVLGGADDPVGNMGKGTISVAKLFKKAGVRYVKSIVYKGARHDLLHEYENRAASLAIMDIINWIGYTQIKKNWLYC